MKKVFILVPAIIQSGPAKGAIALAHAIAPYMETTLVSIKENNANGLNINPEVKTVCLSAINKGFIPCLKSYRNLLAAAGNRGKVVSISMCFSADLMNQFCRKEALLITSIRENRMRSYPYIFGMFGLPLAFIHLKLMWRFDQVVVMTKSMQIQAVKYIKRPPVVIGNFVDENKLNIYRKAVSSGQKINFIYIGRLEKIKMPMLTVSAIEQLRMRGINAHLNIVGAGELMDTIVTRIQTLGLVEYITVHGRMASPYNFLATSHALVLPSVTEGVARASLEALYLGVPVVLRDVDGNAELIKNGVNGELFTNDSELPDKMIAASQIRSKKNNQTGSLLPDFARQKTATKKWCDLIMGKQI